MTFISSCFEQLKKSDTHLKNSVAFLCVQPLQLNDVRAGSECEWAHFAFTNESSVFAGQVSVDTGVLRRVVV